MDLQLQSVVAKLAGLGLDQADIEFFVGRFDDYPDDGLQNIFDDNSGVVIRGRGR